MKKRRSDLLLVLLIPFMFFACNKGDKFDLASDISNLPAYSGYVTQETEVSSSGYSSPGTESNLIAAIDIPAFIEDEKSWELQTDISDDFNYIFSETDSLTEFGEYGSGLYKWYNFYHNTWDGPGTTYWQYDHVSVDGNNLVIRSSRNSSTAKMGVPGVNAGCITSNKTVRYPVFVEASVSVADITLASDVWLLSPDDTQEIDIIECYGGSYSSNSYFSEFIHLSHHSFIRNPFTDYQPRDIGSWWSKPGVSSWGQYCWNGGVRRYVRVGVNWVGPKHFEYYVDGMLVRVLFENGVATKTGGLWKYGFTEMVGSNLKNDTTGYQFIEDYARSSIFSFDVLRAASSKSNVSMIDPFGFQGTGGFRKAQDIIINVESQNWHVEAGRTPSTSDLNNPARNTMLVNWIRVYKPVTNL